MTGNDFNVLMSTPRFYYATPKGITEWIREKGFAAALKEVVRMRRLALELSGEKIPEFILKHEDSFYLIGKTEVFEVKTEIPATKSLPDVSLVEDFKAKTGLTSYEVTQTCF